MIRTQGLTHIHFAVRDLKRSLKFYGDVFGLQVKFWVGSSMVFLGTPGGADPITLRQATDGEPVGPDGGFAHFGFRLQSKDDLEKAIQQVIRAGGSLLERGEHEPGHPYAYRSDPDGYVIEL